MKRFFVIAGVAAATIFARLPTAQAEFFSLDGRYQCLESGATVCGNAQVIVPRPVPPPAPAAAPAPVAVLPIAAPAAAAPAKAASAPVHERPIDPVQVVAARIQARRPSSNDIAFLTQASRNGDVRAIELLAWCKLNGIGMARDPVEAYLLYGAAGNAAVPNARDNQRLIFERDLTSDQRQQMLDLANEGTSMAQLMPSAR